MRHSETASILPNIEKEKSDHNDLVWEEKKLGGVVINRLRMPSELFEEDLAQMRKSETVVTKEEQALIKAEACKRALATVGKYVPRSEYARLFPGLDRETLKKQIKSYDFTNARISVFTLDRGDYDDFIRLYYQKEGIAGWFYKVESEGVAAGGSDKQAYWDADLPMPVEYDYGNQRAIVVMTDTTEGINTKDKDTLQQYLTHKLSHEILHTLGVGSAFSRPLNEGIVEYYARKAQGKGEVILDQNRSYEENVKYVSELTRLLSKIGIADYQIDRFFIAQGDGDLWYVKGRFAEFFNQETADVVFDADYESWEGAFRHLQLLSDQLGILEGLPARNTI
ncbi:MAG: hypothetical protein ACD_22C00009G0004 [uncultured bacterium]|nr:MAG: hypothetical protein ACD_22C00009G0004 [uncultured bacterium]